jgi:hypothetical protein
MMLSPTTVEVFMKSWKQVSVAVDSVDECTAPTFMSVDRSAARVDWPDGRLARFRTSELGSARTIPLPPLVTSPPTTATKPPRGGESTPTGAADGIETRRRLHHEERLRRLTDIFTMASAKAHPERSTPAFSTSVPATEVEDTDEADDDDGAWQDRNWVGRAFDIRRMTSSCGCMLAMLIDDDDTYHHEGLIIGIPIKKDHTLTMLKRSYNSDVSSLTDDTPQSFKKRYYAEDVSDGKWWYK